MDSKLSFVWIILAFLMLPLLIRCSQSTKNIQVSDALGNLMETYQVDKKTNKKSGWYKRFEIGQILIEKAQYLDGQLHGVRILFDSLGNKEIEESYKHGKFEGSFRSYYPDGSIKLEGEYVNNEMEGIWKKYYQNGQLMEEVEMHNNNENGPFKEFYENGNLKAEGTYREGDYEHGLLLLYNEQGVLDRKMECDQGICHTIWKREN